MANSQTETHTHLATLEFLHRREASTYKEIRHFWVPAGFWSQNFEQVCCEGNSGDETHLHDGKVTVDTYAGQKQDAAVHVDKVAEDVQVGAGETSSSTVVEQDASRQREIHQEVGHRQVDGVNDWGGLLLGADTENIKCDCVEHHAHLWEKRGEYEI